MDIWAGEHEVGVDGVLVGVHPVQSGRVRRVADLVLHASIYLHHSMRQQVGGRGWHVLVKADHVLALQELVASIHVDGAFQVDFLRVLGLFLVAFPKLLDLVFVAAAATD